MTSTIRTATSNPHHAHARTAFAAVILAMGVAAGCGGGESNPQSGSDCAAPSYFPDRDDDGYGDAGADGLCAATPGYVEDATDCDDDAPAIHPGATELCNGLDDDCDAATEEPTSGALAFDGDAWEDWTDTLTTQGGEPVSIPADITELHLCDGEYPAPLEVRSDLTITGAGTDHVVLGGGDANRVVSVSGDGVRLILTGLTVAGPARGDDDGDGLECSDGATLELLDVDLRGHPKSALAATACAVSLEAVSIHDNHGGSDATVYLEASEATFVDVNVRDNRKDDGWAGVDVNESTLDWSGGAITGNLDDWLGGAGIWAGDSVLTVADVEFSDNQAPYNVTLWDSTTRIERVDLEFGGSQYDGIEVAGGSLTLVDVELNGAAEDAISSRMDAEIRGERVSFARNRTDILRHTGSDRDPEQTYTRIGSVDQLYCRVDRTTCSFE